MADIVSIEIIPDGAILFLGTSLQYQALATYDDGSVEDVTDLADWTCPETSLEVITPSNDGFETWDGINFTDWVKWAQSGSTATLAKETTIVKEGSSSAKLTVVGAYAALYQDSSKLTGSHPITYYQGKTIRIGAWVYATVAREACLQIIGDGGTWSDYYRLDYHSGSGWEYLISTRKIPDNVTSLRVGLLISDDSTAYVDSFDADIVVDGAGTFDSTTKGLFLPSRVGGTIINLDYGSPIYTSAVTILNPLIVAQTADRYVYDPDVQSYLDLITSQYQNSPKYLHWIRTYLEMVMDIRRLANSLMCYFSFNRVIAPDAGYLDNAWTVREDVDFNFFNFEACVGDQLDILGVILGQSRYVHFAAEPYASPPVDARNEILGDDHYRILLKSKVYFNTWDGKAQSLQDKWQELFVGGTISVIDNQDMSIDVWIIGAIDATLVDLIQNDYVIPRPQGVKINYYYGTTPFFGFDRQDDYIAGFDTGNWV